GRGRATAPRRRYLLYTLRAGRKSMKYLQYPPVLIRCRAPYPPKQLPHQTIAAPVAGHLSTAEYCPCSKKRLLSILPPFLSTSKPSARDSFHSRLGGTQRLQ